MTVVDRYGLPLTTSEAAAAAYATAVDCFLAADPSCRGAIDAVLAADPQFALGHTVCARLHQTHGEAAAARAASARAVELAERASAREQSHVAALHRAVNGDRAGAITAILAHMAAYPRDVMVLMPMAGVFGLIGFSGDAGREERLFEILSAQEPQLGDDWWFLGALAFAEAETGRIEAAREHVARSLALNPRNGNAAHVQAHVHYEAGEADAGLRWLESWFAGYGRPGYLHCHIGWHLAIWNLELGHADAAWRAYGELVQPAGDAGRGAWGPPLNVLTDAAAFLFRVELAGGPRDRARWAEIAAYARAHFPRPGLAFADAHAALAYAMTEDSEALAALVAGACGPVADLVRALALGFEAFAAGRWAEATDALGPAAHTHARLGGSRAQRDLIEQALAVAARHSGRPDLVTPRMAMHAF